jgi:hypothetical protein
MAHYSLKKNGEKPTRQSSSLYMKRTSQRRATIDIIALCTAVAEPNSTRLVPVFHLIADALKHRHDLIGKTEKDLALVGGSW